MLVSKRDALAAQIRDQKHNISTLDAQICTLQQEYKKKIEITKEHIKCTQKDIRILEAIYDGKLKDPLDLSDDNHLLSLDMQLALGSRIALSAGPPLGWTPDQPLYAHRPPFPTEDLMRCSTLFRLMNTATGLASTQVDDPGVVRLKEVSTLNENPMMARENNAHRKSNDESENEMLILDLNPDLVEM